jgi:uncharacterized protein YjbI with pentapeptide repeats
MDWIEIDYGPGKDIENRTSNLSKAVFIAANLEGGNLRNCQIHNTQFIDCNLRHTNFVGANTNDAVFTGSNKQEAILPDDDR